MGGREDREKTDGGAGSVAVPETKVMNKIIIPEAALSQHVAILGKTGSGKTSTAKLAIEQIVDAGGRVCILDPIKSDWWGLTSSEDGKRPGLPFDILGGPRGHVPLHAGAGKAIAEIVGSGALPLSILDMADFDAGGQMRFFVDFAPMLLKKMRGVLHLVIEEAHLFAPKERAGFGSENMAIHWAKTLATAGRSKGVRMIVLTQRTQSLHNALLGSCDSVVVHRFTAPADQEPVIKWLKANVTDKDIRERIVNGMSSLKTGQGWLCSGEAKIFELRQFPRIRTFDNSATPTNDVAEVQVKTAPINQDKLRALIGDAVKDAEENDPKILKGRIAELERAGSRPRELAIDVQALERARQDGYQQAISKLRDIVHDQQRTLAALNDKLIMETAGPIKHVPISEFVSQTRPIGTVYVESSGLPPGERAILVACAQHGGCTREQLTVLTGYKRSSRDTYIQRLKEKGFLQVLGDQVSGTDAGVDALGPNFEPLPKGKALRDYWIGRLPEGERKVFESIVARYPSPMHRDDISGITGYKRSSRDTYLQRLRSRQLVKNHGDSQVIASENLF